MIIGIGTDIIEISRIAESIERLGDRFVNRILTKPEQTQYLGLSGHRAVSFVAKRFAAKEAAVKALGTGIGSGVSFQHFTVCNLDSGKPVLKVANSIHELVGQPAVWHLSLSDEKLFALAFVTLEAKG
ncbi:Holo-[acyl-carrier-protein] synthase [Marinomonas gallaica]|uniref:Holo-[acyl-carrier-protein] synthase n=1 Tax=Marinomonas gallaica TaxID=1806667 RepID=A0A1C3JMP3_9GAMM|nr:holo-ACP synthase [Marinomonas gallaica]SBT16498.1 Holo-[acyl-carrier-protein] synthase [Marinomonas gallaica]SBT20214.1 Holo-[acyl-carrier-protein] synthase [Marinomonas gallaica]